ncbi:MAG: benzaldehyde dehydrogenase [Vicinamibacterales bacterium]
MAETAAALMNEPAWRGRLFLDGWTTTAHEFRVVDKATGSELSTMSQATADDVARAARSARRTQPEWAQMPYEERAAIFRRAGALVEQHADELATWIMRETGAIRPKADTELKMAAGILHASAAMVTEPQGLLLPSNPGRLSMGRRVPHGVVGVIAPFNFPLILAIRAVSPALATGNTVVLKPDPQTAVAGGVLIARVFEDAGLPPGALHVLPGGADVGEALCTDPNVAMVAFTGATSTGRRVGELCGRHLKKVSLELGGKNSLVILDDADLELAASNAAFGAWLHQGQICMASGRILVHEAIAPQLTELLVTKADHLPVGDPMTGTVALGPLISERQIQRVDQIVRDSVASGATLRAGGTHEFLFYRPTVLTGVMPGMRAFDEEIFGPVAAITTFGSDDEAVALANQTEYGLSAAVISRSVSRALAVGNRLNTGLLHINDHTVHDEPHVPFGGRGASGNGGRVGGPANWEEFTAWQWVTIKDVPPRYPF